MSETSLSPRSLADDATLRDATPADVLGILDRIRDLAAYEKEPNAVRTTAEQLHAALFEADAPARAQVIEKHGDVIGIAIWFRSFSTWTGLTGIWLEDLFVVPEERGRGYGLALLVHLAQLAQQRGYARVEWTVLDWNEPSIQFYRSLGAVPMDEWTTQRLDAAAISRVAALSTIPSA
ncbi:MULTISPECIES: GNAT family N-acetyltransferase [unclassified Pseudoclavibacter]|uniref:GNAT family N-acetyltransferase n=1 Tax=unclassified Pseudoclavibacter TaxID=2615177 RepID=UPI00130111C1|nr:MULTISPECIES: GNAT family N-acetyltransferase [unclassified Pseudoclavibacter]KAB1644468.1 GNAT family N-acetyltransferase [Pseudoclavibacter sp. CFCC 14310]KAB1664028.1 GNAT family N-acetyltransferase [Pseudoclavibacter sp. CFCC 13611]